MRPVTMAARIAPYLRYYATRRPIDDHGTLPVVLVAFATTHFLVGAREKKLLHVGSLEAPQSGGAAAPTGVPGSR